jgi:cell division protein FtsQ
MDADAFPQEVLADEEPKYLRRQKPLEIKRRKFGKRAWKTYARVALWTCVGLVGAGIAYAVADFLLASREMALIHPEQVEVSADHGEQLHYVAPAVIRGAFIADRNRSVLRIPLDARRRQLESIPWVEEATVRRALPNKIEVEIKERTPVAFLRQGADMALVDAHGVILERPLEGNFEFPVVTGIRADMAADDREKRMQLFSGFLQQVETARAGSVKQVSEVDLSDANDLRAMITGLQPGSSAGAADAAGSWSQADAPLLVHFGDGDFQTKFTNLLENIGKWRATAGRLESLDLRFNGEAVANPDTSVASKQPAPKQVVSKQVAQQVAPRRAPPQPSPVKSNAGKHPR